MAIVVIGATLGVPGSVPAASTGPFVWRAPDTAMPPIGPTRIEWRDIVNDVAVDETGRFHAVWIDATAKDAPSLYKWSDDGSSWTSDKTFTDARLIRASAGRVYVLAYSGQLHVRNSSGVWSAYYTGAAWTDNHALEVASNGTAWVAYVRRDGYGYEKLYATRVVPGATHCCTVEEIARVGSARIRDLQLDASGAPVIALDAAAGPLYRRAETGWVSDDATGDVATAAALATDGAGELHLLYWRAATLNRVLAWASLGPDGEWRARGDVHPRQNTRSGTVVTAIEPAGTVIAAWNECPNPRPMGTCYSMSSTLAPAASSWTPATKVGSYPRGERTLRLAARADRALLSARHAMDTWIAVSDPSWRFSEPVPAGRPRVFAERPSTPDFEYATAPGDGVYAAWTQSHADDVARAGPARAPRVMFAERSRTGGWSVPEAVDVDPPWRSFGLDSTWDVEPRVLALASAPTGEAFVVWRDRSLADSDFRIVERALGRMRRADGTWGPVESVPYTASLLGCVGLCSMHTRAEFEFHPHAHSYLLDPYGRLWRRDPGGAWFEEAHPPVPQQYPGRRRMVVEASGRQHVAWTQRLEDAPVYVSRRDPAGDWSVPERVDPISSELRLREVTGMVFHAGEIFIAYTERVRDEDDVWAAFVQRWNPTTARWSTRTQVGLTRAMRGMDARAFADGSLWVIWSRCPQETSGWEACEGTLMQNPDYEGDRYLGGAAIVGARRAPDGTWSQPVFVGDLRETGVEWMYDPAALIGYSSPSVVYWTYKNALEADPLQPRIAVGVPQASVTHVVDPPQPRAGEEATMTLTLAEEDGRPLTGRLLTWSTSGVGSLGSVSAETDSMGRVSARVTSTRMGLQTVTLSLFNAPDKIARDIQWLAGAPASVRLTPVSITSTAGAVVPLEARVLDKVGSPVPGAGLTWRIVSGPGGFLSEPDVTGQDGIARAQFRSTATGTTKLSVSVTGASPTAASTLTWTPAAPYSLALTPAAVTAKPGEVVALVAAAHDQFGNATPVSNLVVRWEWSGDGVAGGVPLTNNTGEASARVVSPSAGGTVVRATLHSTGRGGTANVTWRSS